MSAKEKWQGAKALRKEFKQKLHTLKDMNGKEVRNENRADAMAAYLEEVHWGEKGDSTEQLPISENERSAEDDWKEATLRKAKEEVDEHLRDMGRRSTMNVEMDGPITRKEIAQAAQKITRKKAAGTDNITTEWLKDLDEDIIARLQKMVDRWWQEKVWPSKSEEARVATLHKKADVENPEKDRPLSLLNTQFQLLAAIIKKSIETELKGQLGETHFGFRAGRRTTQAIYVAMRIQGLESRGRPDGMKTMIGKIFGNLCFYIEIDGTK